MTFQDRRAVDAERVVAALRRHLAVRDAAVMRTLEPPGEQLVAYIVPAPASSEIGSSLSKGTDAEQVAKWRKLSEVTYSRIANASAPLSGEDIPAPDFAGWKSSYTAQPLPQHEMVEWVDQTVTQLLSFGAKNVLEIGCGLGLLMFRVAPHCDEYRAIDFYEGCVNFCRRRVEGNPRFTNVKLAQVEAVEISNVPQNHFDLIIINSVAQYFPSGAYLRDVLQKAAAALRAGGAIFIGDIRSLHLQQAFALSVVMSQARATDTMETLRAHLRRRVEAEAELAVAPGFFHAIRSAVPELGQVIIEPQRGRADNELTHYRFNATLRKSTPSASSRALDAQDWLTDHWTLDRLKSVLSHDRPDQRIIRNVPNARIQLETAAAALVSQAPDDMTVTDLRAAVAARTAAPAIQPQDLWDLERSLDYRVRLSWSSGDPSGAFDLVLSRGNADIPIDPPISIDPDWSRFVNDPLRKRRSAVLKAQLDDWLKSQLPPELVPPRLVVVDQIPATDS